MTKTISADNTCPYASNFEDAQKMINMLSAAASAFGQSPGGTVFLLMDTLLHHLANAQSQAGAIACLTQSVGVYRKKVDQMLEVVRENPELYKERGLVQ